MLGIEAHDDGLICACLHHVGLTDMKDSFNRELSTMELRFRAGNYGALHDVAGERLVELRSSLSSPRRADRHEGQF